MIDRILRLALLVLLVGHSTLSLSYDDAADESIDYLFAWPFVETDDMAPRGGTTSGPMPEVVREPTERWQHLQAEGLSKVERDRRAILAMAGAYRTSFDFLETIGFAPGFTPAKPYRSWGTEYVYVLTDEPGFIQLQHILVMVLEQDDGSLSDPIVTKHWRQDWRFEDTDLHEYVSHGVWERTTRSEAEASGRWSQAVWQVDDSPRYESIGQWRHEPTHSVWEGHPTRRPLPRREFSVRDDYNVLLGTNRHTILPTGWTHEQDNLKMVTDETGTPDPVTPFLAREIGVNRYDRITGFDFSAGDAYWEASGEYWAMVRERWTEQFETFDRVRVEATIDGTSMMMTVFGKAMQIAAGSDYDAEQAAAELDALFERHVSGSNATD
ncbi:hypothetical protein HFP89_11125 [Wenzhouxiangella sp. XN79A]|uniref:DUF6607 family protein n=1 Tax=Wenzhouxiangella sp. XN79A TaxID=2724193 RepID=UPI00144A5C0C|nr:DUF6607 family protein [Wenzhouxiangella sp. XN79A]NKI35713.1 hypothetical protein [Wenzhouxiangella sp. XN79A]